MWTAGLPKVVAVPRPALPVDLCQVADRHPHRAWVEVCIAGTYHAEGPPVKSCRGHVSVIIDKYLLISDDIRVKGIK